MGGGICKKKTGGGSEFAKFKQTYFLNAPPPPLSMVAIHNLIAIKIIFH